MTKRAAENEKGEEGNGPQKCPRLLEEAKEEIPVEPSDGKEGASMECIEVASL